MRHHISVLIFIVFIGCSNQPGQKVDTDSTYTWKKILDGGEWKKSYNFQMFSLRDSLWIFHPDGNWASKDGYTWNKTILPNVINNLAFLDYVPFKEGVLGLGHFEGNIERFSFSSGIVITIDGRHWNTLSVNSNLPARFFYHPFVFNDKLWIIGGEDKDRQFADIWNSEDGVRWTKQKDGLPFGPRSNSQVVLLDDKLYLLNNDVWSSTDALHWELVSPEILRGETVFGYAALVYDRKIWLIGCNRNGLFSSQVLVSADGKTWQSMEAPWSPRGGVAAAVHNGKIFMTGGKYGGTTDAPDFRYSNDLWVMEKSK
ncbi:hypothetical protein [Flavihumibacter fluvii]|uniref:hypothetical protein n=1 Tax=Flavihumibacter fluvii TaxID=2838157 RepID=UPI001BDDED11|nr:hypothetical protein [Flavihumibacter fluvii]ULQ52785.1 hypothetical protein KJS93_00430 [Flavihumibacter fluvii]